MKHILIGLLIMTMGLSLSSCMMMMPGHMSGSMPEAHNHDGSVMEIDKVCGKHVGVDGSYTYKFQGINYYFDTEQCLSVFKNNPDHFLQKQNQDTHTKSWTKVAWVGGAVLMTTMMVFMLTRVF